MIAFAAVLALAAAAAWIAAGAAPARCRTYLRFACVLYTALAISAAMNLAPAASAQIVMPLAGAALALAAYGAFAGAAKPVFAALILSTACLAGIWSAASGESLPAVLVQSLCLIAMLMVARKVFLNWRAPNLYLALGGLALLAALCAAQLNGKSPFMALLLFSAAGLLGTALALARVSKLFVEGSRRIGNKTAIRRMR